MPDAIAWNRQIATEWVAVFQSQALPLTGTIVEVGPGFADKIAQALASLDFRGTVILVEPNPSARRWAARQYQLLLEQAEIVALDETIPLLDTLDGHSIDAMVGNHLFDDMILNAFLGRETGAHIFSQMQLGASCSPEFLAAWHRLIEAPGQSARVVSQVVQELSLSIDRLRPRLLAMNHYRSWRHRQHGLDWIDTFAERVMTDLEECLGLPQTARFTRFVQTSPRSLRWLIGNLKGNRHHCTACSHGF